MKLLLEAGADINAQDDERSTPISYALPSAEDPFCFNGVCRPNTRGNPDTVMFLLSRGASINVAANQSMDLIHVACMKGFMVDVLTANGASVHLPDFELWTPFTLQCTPKKEK